MTITSELIVLDSIMFFRLTPVKQTIFSKTFVNLDGSFRPLIFSIPKSLSITVLFWQ